MSNNNMQTTSTYTTDCFRAVKDEDGDMVVKRWVEERQVAVTLNTYPEVEGVFWKGARVA